MTRGQPWQGWRVEGPRMWAMLRVAYLCFRAAWALHRLARILEKRERVALELLTERLEQLNRKEESDA